jgi:hypothetical protein
MPVLHNFIHPQGILDTILGWKYAALLQNSKEVMRKSEERLLQRIPSFMTVLRYML